MAGRACRAQHRWELRGPLPAYPSAVVPDRLRDRSVRQGLTSSHFTVAARSYPTHTAQESPLHAASSRGS
ncbi:hypothetical protein ACFPRL_06545 [Pseudoclavibacter helvolus]